MSYEEYKYGPYEVDRRIELQESSSSELEQAVLDYEDAELRVAAAEVALQTAKDHLEFLRKERLPELMNKFGCELFRGRNGKEVILDMEVYASIPKTRLDEAFDWLRNEGHGGLIKRALTVKFGKGKDKAAEELMKLLMSKKYDVNSKTEVHYQTLQAWVKEMLKEGQEFPLDLFGVHRQEVAKVKTVK